MTSVNLVAVDTCVLINFIRVGRLDLLVSCPGVRYVITDEVLLEITDPTQKAEVLTAIKNDEFEQFSLVEVKTIERFVELSAVMGKGEASAISAAEAAGWFVATDEGSRARRTVTEGACSGRLMTTPGILLHLVKSGNLSVEAADKIKTELEGYRFVMNFTSFRDLL